MTIAAALEYAGHRWRVFPVHSIREGRCTCRTACGRDAGKHPRTCNGVKDATTDERIIRKWWTWWPEANVAIATGRASGMWALDVDDEDAFTDLERHHGAFPETATARTGRGGRHLLLCHPGFTIPNRVGLVPGIDVRGD